MTPSNTELRITVDGKQETLEFLFEALYPNNPNNPRAIKILADSFQAREQQMITELLGELPEKRELLEPVTKRVVTEVGDKVGIDVDADLKGSLKFVQDNGYNIAIDQVVSVIERYREGL